jgi:hypothetical protein
MDRKQAEAYLIEKAQQDEAFRQRLIDDPAGVVSSEFKLTIPPRTKLTVLEESVNSLYLVLPPRTTGELNQEQLASVVAGATGDGKLSNFSSFMRDLVGGSGPQPRPTPDPKAENSDL